jgi:hypothetical protein
MQNKEDSFKLLDAFVDAGGQFIDTANVYQVGQNSFLHSYPRLSTLPGACLAPFRPSVSSFSLKPEAYYCSLLTSSSLAYVSLYRTSNPRNGLVNGWRVSSRSLRFSDLQHVSLTNLDCSSALLLHSSKEPRPNGHRYQVHCRSSSSRWSLFAWSCWIYADVFRPFPKLPFRSPFLARTHLVVLPYLDSPATDPMPRARTSPSTRPGTPRSPFTCPSETRSRS